MQIQRSRRENSRAVVQPNPADAIRSEQTQIQIAVAICIAEYHSRRGTAENRTIGSNQFQFGESDNFIAEEINISNQIDTVGSIGVCVVKKLGERSVSPKTRSFEWIELCKKNSIVQRIKTGI